MNQLYTFPLLFNNFLQLTSDSTSPPKTFPQTVKYDLFQTVKCAYNVYSIA